MIFEKLFGKKDDEDRGRKGSVSALEFDELPQWIEGEREMLDLKAVEVARMGVDKINTSFDNLEIIINDLEESEIDQEVVKKLENITITSKKKFCENIMMVLAKRKKMLPEGHRELNEFIRDSEETVNNINKAHHTHGKYLGITFQSYLKDMGKELKIIMTMLNAMKERMREPNARWDELSRIGDTIDEYRLLDQSDANIRLEGIEAEKIRLNAELEGLERKKNEIVDGPAHKRYLEVLERLDAIEDEMHDINIRIYDEVGPLKRALKKMHKAMEGGRFKTTYDDGEYMKAFIEHPAVTIISEDDRDLSRTRKLMRALLDAIEGDVIDEKRSKLEKTVSIGRGILNGNLNDMKGDHMGLEKELKDLETFKGSHDLEDLRKIEKEMEQSSHRIQTLDEELEHGMEISNDVQEKKDKAKIKIKKMIEGFYPEITINL
ncbi:MAG TPA: hypothetical protein PK718_03250 [Candidatus Methanofastidiosa archaeon]|nr:hypothetical protein [Candidatus Methanofastidiosa archaeon]